MNDLTREYLDESGLTDDDFNESWEYDAVKNPDEYTYEENSHCLQLLNIIMNDAIEADNKEAVKVIRQDIQRMKEKMREMKTDNHPAKEILTA